MGWRYSCWSGSRRVCWSTISILARIYLLSSDGEKKNKEKRRALEVFLTGKTRRTDLLPVGEDADGGSTKIGYLTAVAIGKTIN